MKRVTILIAAVIVAACAQPSPPTRSPIASLAPPASATPDATAALRVGGTGHAACFSIGGCAYFAELRGLQGSWKAEFMFDRDGGAIVIGAGLPATLPSGDYTLTLSYNPVSDALVANGGRGQLGPAHAMCSAEFTVAPGQALLSADGSFDRSTCSIEITG